MPARRMGCDMPRREVSGVVIGPRAGLEAEDVAMAKVVLHRRLRWLSQNEGCRDYSCCSASGKDMP